MSYEVAIPTYRRPQMVADKTLRLLTDRGVPPRCITLFVADEAEAAAYRARVPPSLYGDLVVSAPGLGPSRNFIASYYPAGAHVLSADDDVDDLVELQGKQLVPVADVDELIASGFSACCSLGLRLWGVYPVANAFFMRPRSTTDLRFIPGPFFGTVATPDNPALAHNTLCMGGEKDDYERTLRYFEVDGGVLRLGHVAIKTRWYRNPGGLGDTRTRATEESAVAALRQRWPAWVHLATRRGGDYPEVRLRAPSRRPR